MDLASVQWRGNHFRSCIRGDNEESCSRFYIRAVQSGRDVEISFLSFRDPRNSSDSVANLERRSSERLLAIFGDHSYSTPRRSGSIYTAHSDSTKGHGDGKQPMIQNLQSSRPRPGKYGI